MAGKRELIDPGRVIGHLELDPFKRNFAAARDVGPCHVEMASD